MGQWMPPGWTEDGFCLNPLMGATVPYACHFPSGRRAAFDAQTGEFPRQVPWPDAVSSQRGSKRGHSSGYGGGIDFYLISGTDTVIHCDGERAYQYNPRQPDLPATIPLSEFEPPLDLEMRYHVTSDCRVLKYDKNRLQVVRSLSPPQPQVARGLHGLGTGPDGKVYGGAYQSTLLFRYDPATQETKALGDHPPDWMD